MTEGIEPSKKLEEAIGGLAECATAAADVQKLFESVKRWEGQLMYLLGDRAKVHCRAAGLKLVEDADGVKLRTNWDNTELTISGTKAEFQRLACEILAKLPLTYREGEHDN